MDDPVANFLSDTDRRLTIVVPSSMVSLAYTSIWVPIGLRSCQSTATWIPGADPICSKRSLTSSLLYSHRPIRETLPSVRVSSATNVRLPTSGTNSPFLLRGIMTRYKPSSPGFPSLFLARQSTGCQSISCDPLVLRA